MFFEFFAHFVFVFGKFLLNATIKKTERSAYSKRFEISTSKIAIRTTSNSKTEVPIMLLESGDLFPVIEEAVDIPWTKRKNLIANFLYRGSVTFQTLVYDSNVGDIAPLSMYFNPRKWTVFDLNQKFGQVADEDDRSETSSNLTIGP